MTTNDIKSTSPSTTGTGTRTFSLRLYGISLDAVAELHAVEKAIRKHDPDLADELRRASKSMHLNLAEGMDTAGRNRNARFRIALGECNECLAILDIARAREQATPNARCTDRVQHVRATLLKLTR
ncbi:MAG: four helix bundle protein [Sandaracinaceae bacterium]|nr:four helix bundle protein [Sandaracinaceae bacterium]